MCVFPITGTLCCFMALGGVGCAWEHLCSMGRAPVAGPSCCRGSCQQAGCPQGAGKGDGGRVAVSAWAQDSIWRNQCSPLLLCQGPDPHKSSFFHAIIMFPVAAAASAALGLIRSGARHSAWAGWHGTLLVEGFEVAARRLLPVDKYYHPISPWARQCSRAVASLLKRWGPGPAPPGSALLMRADREG